MSIFLAKYVEKAKAYINIFLIEYVLKAQGSRPGPPKRIYEYIPD